MLLLLKLKVAKLGSWLQCYEVQTKLHETISDLRDSNICTDMPKSLAFISSLQFN